MPLNSASTSSTNFQKIINAGLSFTERKLNEEIKKELIDPEFLSGLNNLNELSELNDLYQALCRLEASTQEQTVSSLMTIVLDNEDLLKKFIKEDSDLGYCIEKFPKQKEQLESLKGLFKGNEDTLSMQFRI